MIAVSIIRRSRSSITCIQHSRCRFIAWDRPRAASGPCSVTIL